MKSIFRMGKGDLMPKRIGASIAISLLLLSIVGCHMQFVPPETSTVPGAVPGASDTAVPGPVTETVAAPLADTPTFTLTFTPTASQTPLPSFTWTLGKVTISVSMDTNCRSGPGTVYDYLGGLMVGETTEVLGRDSSGQFWVVRNPDIPGGICWLWNKYATLTGDTSKLPVATPPPTPTPAELAPDPLPAAYTGIILNNGQCFNLDNGQVTAPDGQCDLLLMASGVFHQVNGAKLSGYDVSYDPPTRTKCVNVMYDPGDLAIQTDLHMCVISSQGRVGFIVVRQYLGGIPVTGIVLDYWLFR
jgi:hypothetical protein